MNGMSEKEIQARVLIKLNSRSDTRVFRNNVGVGWVGSEYKCVADLARALSIIAAEIGKNPLGSVQAILNKLGIIVLHGARKIRFGLHEGSGDLVGWKTITITPEMVGSHVAVFFSNEIKSPAGRLSDEQKNWAVQVTKAGGIAKVMRSPEDANVA
jgi:hypothetical protein